MYYSPFIRCIKLFKSDTKFYISIDHNLISSIINNLLFKTPYTELWKEGKK